MDISKHTVDEPVGDYLVAAVQMISGASIADNLAQTKVLIEQAAGQGARLIALPEYFCLLGPDENAKVAAAEHLGEGPIQDFVSELSARLGVWISAGTIPLVCPQPGKVFNTSLLYGPDGQVVARYDKIHLFRYASEREDFDETRTICAGQHPVSVQCALGRIGLSVCYDLRFPELYREMNRPDLILVPSAFTYVTGQAHWSTLLRARAIENQCYVLAAAQGGVHPHGRQTWGHSMLIDPWGEVIAQKEQGAGLVMGQFDFARLDEVRQSLPALDHRIIGIK